MKEQFEHILQDKLQDFSMKPESRDWIAIERSLGLDAPVRKPVPLFRYVATAAAVLIVAACGFYFWRLDPIADSAPLVAATAPVQENTAQAIHHSASKESEALEAVLKLKETIDRSNGVRQQVPHTPAGIVVAQYEAPREVSSPAGGVSGTSSSAVASGQDPGRVPSRSNGQGNQTQNRAYNVPVAPQSMRAARNRPNSNWSLSLFADGTSGINAPKSYDMDLRAQDIHYSLSDLSAVLSSKVPNSIVEYELNEKNNLLSVKEADWSHSIPLSFGVAVRKNLTPRWGIETGLVYSYLTSKAKTSSLDVKQQLHYLSIPLSVSYSFVYTSNFDFYARAGGAADFNIAGQRKYLFDTGNSESHGFTASGVQWSISGNLGLMYNISPTVGVYFEPGIGHYFERSNQPPSYWTENPTNFNMKIGVRTNF